MTGSIKRFILRWKFVWKVFTVLALTGAVLIVVFLFPGVNNLWVSIFVLVSGLTAAVGDLIDEIADE